MRVACQSGRRERLNAVAEDFVSNLYLRWHANLVCAALHRGIKIYSTIIGISPRMNVMLSLLCPLLEASVAGSIWPVPSRTL